jgi:hypothetical protein
MTTRPGPAAERGGTPIALDALRKKSGLKKARNTSVIAEMTRVEEEESQHAALHVVHDSPSEPENSAPAAQAQTQEPTAAPAAPEVQPAPVQLAPAQQPAAQPVPQSTYAQASQQEPRQPAAYLPPAQQVQLRQPDPEPPVVEKKTYRKTSFFQSKESGARMRSAYMATRHLTASRTLSDFILAAVEREVEALERQYNNGEMFTADPGSVPRGRPLET